MKPYLKISKDCGVSTNDDCFARHYKALFNDYLYYNPNNYSNHYKFVLSNGASVDIKGGTRTNNPVTIMVDVNGVKPPNRQGVDYHTINIDPAKGVHLPDYILNPDEYCLCTYKNTSDRNGSMCAIWAVEMGNMDYLRRDITEDWKKHKGIK